MTAIELNEINIILDYWHKHVEKKLLRCAKDLGFYITLKKAVTRSKHEFIPPELMHLSEKDRYVYNHQIKKINKELNNQPLLNYHTCYNRFKFLKKKKDYPIFASKISCLYFCHRMAYLYLVELGLNHEKLLTAFEDITNSMFKGHKIKCFFIEKLCRLLTGGKTIDFSFLNYRSRY